MYPRLMLKREQTARMYCIFSKKSNNTDFHFHSHIEIYLVESGEVDVWVGRRYKRLSGGDMAVMLSYDAHRYAPVGDAKITCLIVPPSKCGELSHKNISNPFINNKFLFDNIRRCCEQIDLDKNSLLTDGCTSIVFGLLLEHLDFTERESTVETDSMSKMLVYIHENFRGAISLETTAAALGYNPSYLSRQFKAALGIGFNSYVTILRLRSAVLLLQKGEPISFCAYESGFNSIRTFYRSFSAEFGCTPKEYLGQN